MKESEKEIEVCLGVGMDQIFPEIIKIKIPTDFDQEKTVEESNESNKK